jgi:magnesium transporter
MLHVLKPRYREPGTAPGLRALEVATDGASLSVFDFDKDSVTEERDVSVERCKSFAQSARSTWIHVQGAPDLAMVRFLGEAYGIHQLAMEDVVHQGQRSKLEAFENQLFCVLNWPRFRDGHIDTVQISLFLGDTYVISFCAGSDDPFGPIHERIHAAPPGRIRDRGAHFLFYALIDLVIDQGFPALDALSERLESLEDSILQSPDPGCLDTIHATKRNLIVLRKTLWPQREVVNVLLREDHPLIAESTRVYLRDCYDHAIQIMDLVESYRDMASGLQDLYLSSLSHRMNEVMKVLTIIATIFIPLSFLTGLYGMNFNAEISPWNMPELNARYGYPIFLAVLIGVAGALLIYFRRRHWL